MGYAGIFFGVWRGAAKPEHSGPWANGGHYSGFFLVASSRGMWTYTLCWPAYGRSGGKPADPHSHLTCAIFQGSLARSEKLRPLIVTGLSRVRWFRPGPRRGRLAVAFGLMHRLRRAQDLFGDSSFGAPRQRPVLVIMPPMASRVDSAPKWWSERQNCHRELRVYARPTNDLPRYSASGWKNWRARHPIHWPIRGLCCCQANRWGSIECAPRPAPRQFWKKGVFVCLAACSSPRRGRFGGGARFPTQLPSTGALQRELSQTVLKTVGDRLVNDASVPSGGHYRVLRCHEEPALAPNAVRAGLVGRDSFAGLDARFD